MDAPKAIFPLNEQPGKADPILEDQLTTLLNDNPDVNHSEVIPELVKSLGGFSESISADASFASLMFYVRLNIVVRHKDFRKGFTGNLGGLGSVGANVSFGTLYYNNVNDFSGSCDVNVNASPVAVNINFIRGGNTFATFVGGGIGTISGIFGGTGSWSNI